MGKTKKEAVATAYKAAADVKAAAVAAATKRAPAPAPMVESAASKPIDVSLITVDKNSRHRDITPETDPGLSELAESIKQVGVIEPLILNHKGADAYIVVAGHRRLAAAKIAGTDTVPARVYQYLTPRQVLEIQISENIHRADLTPVEEADVYARMRDELGMAAEDIALRVGRSQAHVRRYLNLLSLPDDVLGKIDSGEIAVSKGVYLSTLAAHIVDKIVNGNCSYLLGRSTKDFIAGIKSYFMTELDEDTPFDTAKEYKGEDGAVLPPCAKCPGKRQMELFEDFITAPDCPDEQCYYEKRDAQEKLDEKREAARRKKAGNPDEGVEDVGGGFDDRDPADRLARQLDDADDDEEYQETEAERKECEEREAKRQENYRQVALRMKKKAEYYLDIKAKKGFNPLDFFWAAEDFVDNDGALSSLTTQEKEVYDQLLLKYTGCDFETVSTLGVALDIIKAYVIYTVFNNCEYNDEIVADWLGCEEYKEPEEDKETD
jgi:ParB/RepB/Spo0J family partition protein